MFYRTPQKHELQKICLDYVSTIIEDNSETITNAIVDLLMKVFTIILSIIGLINICNNKVHKIFKYNNVILIIFLD